MGLYNYNFNCASLFLLKKSMCLNLLSEILMALQPSASCILAFWGPGRCEDLQLGSKRNSSKTWTNSGTWLSWFQTEWSGWDPKIVWNSEIWKMVSPRQQSDSSLPRASSHLATQSVGFWISLNSSPNDFMPWPRKSCQVQRSFAVKQMKQKHGTLCAPCGHYVARISLGVEPNRWHTTSTSQLIQMFFRIPT